MTVDVQNSIPYEHQDPYLCNSTSDSQLIKFGVLE